MDERLKPYAGFLENLIKTIVELKPEQIAVVAVTEDGTALTATYGDVQPYDLATIAFHLQADAMLDIIKANARDIIEAAEEEEE